MKKLLFIILVLTLILMLPGCNTNSLQEYKKAAEKTSNINRGQSSGDFNMVMDFNTDNLTEEEIRELNYYKNLDASFVSVYDKNLNKRIIRNYLNFGGIGFDFELFINNNEMFIKLPIVGKYLNLSDIEKQEHEKIDKIISKETLEEISSYWIGLMNEEDVFRGKDIIVTTPDGEVKTKEYTVNLNNEQINKLFLYVTECFSKDEDLKSFYYKIQNNIEPIKNKSFDEAIIDLKNIINNFQVQDFSYIAYVDIDGYIVNEKMELNIKRNNYELNELVSIDFNFSSSNWNINKEQKFDFPVLDVNNTLNIDDTNINLPSIFENMYKNME